MPTLARPCSYNKQFMITFLKDKFSLFSYRNYLLEKKAKTKQIKLKKNQKTKTSSVKICKSTKSSIPLLFYKSINYVIIFMYDERTLCVPTCLRFFLYFSNILKQYFLGENDF